MSSTCEKKQQTKYDGWKEPRIAVSFCCSHIIMASCGLWLWCSIIFSKLRASLRYYKTTVLSSSVTRREPCVFPPASTLFKEESSMTLFLSLGAVFSSNTHSLACFFDSRCGSNYDEALRSLAVKWITLIKWCWKQLKNVERLTRIDSMQPKPEPGGYQRRKGGPARRTSWLTRLLQ